MNSDLTIPPPSPLAWRYRWHKRLRALSPWLVWLGALILIVVVGWNNNLGGLAPGVAELRQHSLSSEVDAQVRSLGVRPGQDVEAGQRLMLLSAPSLEASLAVAEAELERLQLDVPAQHQALQQSAFKTGEGLASEVEQAALTVARMEAKSRRNKAELAQLDAQIAKQQTMVDERLVAATALNALKLRRAALAGEVEEYGRTFAQARAHQSAASQRLKLWQSGQKDVPRAAPRYSPQAQPTQANNDPQLAPLQAAVRAQTQRCQALRRQLAALEIRAPRAGRVGQIFFQVGDSVPAGALLTTVIDRTPQQVIAYPDQMWAHRVHLGDQALLRPSNGAGPSRKGQVIGLGAAISELPQRFRPIPTQPAYGREVYIALDSQSRIPPLPGQAFDVSFRHRAAVSSPPQDASLTTPSVPQKSRTTTEAL